MQSCNQEWGWEEDAPSHKCTHPLAKVVYLFKPYQVPGPGSRSHNTAGQGEHHSSLATLVQSSN